MKFLICASIFAMIVGGTATAQNTPHDILKQSLRAQRSLRSLSGNYRGMYTNFALDDNTLASDYSGRFILMRSQQNGPIDRLFCRVANNLKGEPGDSISWYADGDGIHMIRQDGTGEYFNTEGIEITGIGGIITRITERTQLMMDSTATVQLPDTLIDGRPCYLFFLHISSHNQSGSSDGWYKLAIDRQHLLPLWYGRRDRSTGNFAMDQSSIDELNGLQVNPHIMPDVCKAPVYKTAQQVKLGSCNVGEQAPLWENLPDAATGCLYSLDSLLKAGNVVVMDWSTSTCGACIMAMPTIDSLYREYRDKGSKVSFIMMDHGDSREQALSLTKRKKIEYPVLLCPKSVADAYGLHAYPVFLVIGTDGQIVFNQGGFGGDSNNLRKRLTEAINTMLFNTNQD